MSGKNLANFYRQFATLIEAGLPITRCLSTLAQQERGALRRLAQDVGQRIDRGSDLADAMAATGWLPTLQINLIRAGEQSGKLEHAMTSIAEGLERMHRLKREMLQRMLYPAILLHVAIGAPAFVAFFAASTKLAVMILAGGLLPPYGLVLALWFLLTIGRRIGIIRGILDVIGYYTPLLAGMVRHLALARFTQAFEALYSAGVATPKAVEMAADTAGNAVLAKRLHQAVPILKEGNDVGLALEATNVFSPMTINMIHTGVESGKLDEMLDRAADQAGEEAAAAIKRLGVIIPAIVYVIAAGIAIAMIVMMLMQYINTINEALGG